MNIFQFGPSKLLLGASLFALAFASSPSLAHFKISEPRGSDESSHIFVMQSLQAGPSNSLKTDIAQDDQVLRGAQTFIDNMGKRAIKFLGDQSLTQTQRRKEFEALLKDSFDMKTIGRFSLGRYWRVSSEKQRSEYLDLFEKMVIDVYSNRFGEYSGQKFEVRSGRKENEKDMIVHSYVVPDSGPEITVDWRVRYKDSRYKVVDVIVEGVSMSLTQRSDFASVIQRGGGQVDILLAHLRKN